MTYEDKKLARLNAVTAYQLGLITHEEMLTILREIQDI